MKRLLRFAHRLVLALGWDPTATRRALGALPGYWRDWREFRRQAAGRTLFPIEAGYPCLLDRTTDSGSASGHYFHQDLWVARRIFQARPEVHLDVGSRVDGFVAHLAVFRVVKVLDIRPLQSRTANIEYMQADLMQELPPALLECCDSLSCLHSLEHFGLGRYGDPICYEGHLHGLRHLLRLLKPGGKFYISVPIGPQRVEFNGHRVFALDHMLELLTPSCVLDAFSYVDDRGDLHENQTITAEAAARSFGCVHGCGIFELTKRSV